MADHPEIITYASIFIFLFLPIFLGLVVGSFLEKAHFKAINIREEALSHLITTNLKKLPEGRKARSYSLVKGEVVISSDYFKTLIASFKHIFGGRLKTMETLLDRARREAFLRLKEEAEESGASMVINVRFVTTSLGGTMVEVLAYGTAVTLA